MQTDSIAGAPGARQPQTDPRNAALRAATRELETVFLTEMLESAGLGETEGPFTGGIGESQFASFLRAEQAARMVEAGGIGLAEQLFHALEARSDAR